MAEARRKEVERSRIDMMRAYAELRTCRRAFLLAYFGEDPPVRCGRCDVCDEFESVGTPAEGAGEDERAGTGLRIGGRVRHPSWGEGVVQHGDTAKVTVAFEEVGYKTLALQVLRERDDVLVPAD